MEPTIFALGIACSQVLMLTLIIAKSIYSHHKIEVKVLTNVLTNGHVEKYKNVILFGGPGTGKTLVLAELLKMRIAHYKRTGKRYRVIVVVCRPTDEQKLLLEDLKKKYFQDFSEIEYLEEVDFVTNYRKEGRKEGNS